MSRVQQATATREALLDAADDLFATRGYADVGTEEIVRAARVTRGALYHHFADKKDLFRAVHDRREQQLVASLGERIGGIADPWELILVGLRAFLDACTDPATIRIGMVDAPVVLGWTEWRAVDARYGLGLVEAALENAMAAEVIVRQPVRPLAHLLLGALSEAALLIAHAEDHAAARREIEPPLMDLVDGLRA